jgi:hypothetical protein
MKEKMKSVIGLLAFGICSLTVNAETWYIDADAASRDATAKTNRLIGAIHSGDLRSRPSTG